jgi:O-acetyl-ADP-ribose deacetylase (regulator of RNase III)
MKDKIKVVTGDLLTQDVDAIVNAANTHLMHGAGVAGAIAKAAGPAIHEESAKLRPVPTGGAVFTTAGELPFKAVVHAVGPVWGQGEFEEATLLRYAHRSAIIQAARAGAQSVAFPAISCGIFGYPVEEAAPIALSAAVEGMRYVEDAGREITEVRFVLREEDGYYEAFAAALEAL